MIKGKKYFRQGIYALLLSLFLAGTSVSVRAAQEAVPAEMADAVEDNAGKIRAAENTNDPAGDPAGTVPGDKTAEETAPESKPAEENGPEKEPDGADTPKEPEEAPKGPVTCTSFKASATQKQLAKGTFVAEVRGLSCESGIKQVSMRVYSKKDKSNSHTYTAEKKASGHYRVTVDISNHKDQLGEYKVQLVVTDKKGKKKTLDELAVYDFSVDKGTTTAELNKTEKKIRLGLSGASAPGGIKKVEFSVYAKERGAKKADVFSADLDKKTGEYTTTVKLSALSAGLAGAYVARAKVYAACGAERSLDQQEFVVSDCDGKLSVKLVDEDTGRYRLKVSSLASPSGIKKVQFKVWTGSEKDAVLYDAKGSGDARSYTLNLTDFNGSLGRYHVQALVTMGNGIVSAAAGDTFKPELTDYLYVLKQEKNTVRKICMKNISRKGAVTFRVWSDKNGKDDLVSCKASRSGDTAKVTFKTNSLKNAGKVYVAAYVKGEEVKTISIKIPASDMKKNGWYYEKYNGETYKFYYKNGSKVKDLTKILDIGKSEDLYIEVNRRHCTVTVFAKDGEKGYIIPVISFACSVGKASTPTPRGTYYTDRKHRWKGLMGPSYGQYATHVVGGIYFHSVAGSSMSIHNIKASNYNMLGSPASHGCIRLCVRDAKWIYDHCALKTKVKIFDSSHKGPLGKPRTIKISASTNYDPTDPALH